MPDKRTVTFDLSEFAAGADITVEPYLSPPSNDPPGVVICRDGEKWLRVRGRLLSQIPESERVGILGFAVREWRRRFEEIADG